MSLDVGSEELGLRLRRARLAVPMTIEELAGASGVSARAISDLERGRTRRPYPGTVRLLTAALGLPVSAKSDVVPSPPVQGLVEGEAKLVEPALQVPRQLPAAVACFTGRELELTKLTGMLGQSGTGVPGTVVISAISGTAGVGKTALALHWAHQVAGRFPGGQLYVNLRGFDPSGTAAAPAEVIRGFLEALGIPRGQLPLTAEAQAGMYRSLLVGRMILIVLDNARDEQQVRPLLPASPGSMVIVTSRNPLTGLAAVAGARLVPLDVLSPAEAVRMLAARLDPAWVSAEPNAMSEIASLCACLPLALAVAAARAAARPRFALAALATELRDVAGSLDALSSGDPGSSVRAVFSWSYHQLTSQAARMFQLLGMHGGPDITIPAAASLAGCDRAEARRLLAELASVHLTAEHLPGRYAFHDLLRSYSAELARVAQAQRDQHDAIGRVLDHYLHTAQRAALLIKPARDPITIGSPRPGVTPEHMAGRQQAREWFEAERRVLPAAVALADSTGFDFHAWQIPWTVADFMDWRGDWHLLADIQTIAVAAATRLHDVAGQAVSLRHLAIAYSRLGNYDQALAHTAASLRLCQQLGDRLGEANVHFLQATVAESQGRYADALGHCQQALRLYRESGSRQGEARMLNNIAWDHDLIGDYHQARRFCQQSLALTDELGLQDVAAAAWHTLGYAEHHLGDHAEATHCYQRALSLHREAGNRVGEADALTHLGDCRQDSGELAGARQAWQQALAIFEDLQHLNARKVGLKLASTHGVALSESRPLNQPELHLPS